MCEWNQWSFFSAVMSSAKYFAEDPPGSVAKYFAVRVGRLFCRAHIM